MDLKDIKKPQLYGMKDAAESMGVSYHTLWRMVRDGKIKVVSIAKSGKKPIYGFKAEDIQAYYDAIIETKRR